MWEYSFEFQCPRGHFLFSGNRGKRGKIRLFTCFNALAGIFCFLARAQQARESAGIAVSMPARAFFVFWRKVANAGSEAALAECFNALAGIFCFLA